ncbi:hypothetical protein PIIN_09063 [Serendipita indica DSM 11827]|uniref:Uncharacterized protein n=1 Tax=Serendipita indica (strain DSM 11827) TaxID=1109443 RepID=G4TUT5_SERID|nr:hypothetical protein PIIN_09063 [Serendipita indica DSM 11827]
MALLNLPGNERSHNLEYQPGDSVQPPAHRLINPASKLPLLPVEIWHRIFQLYLGPSITSLPQSSLYGYARCISLHSGEAGRIYREKEQMRAVLRCVCRTWKTLSDNLDDAVLMSHLDEFDWPPGRSKLQAKAIYYFSHELQHQKKDPVKTYRDANVKVIKDPPGTKCFNSVIRSHWLPLLSSFRWMTSRVQDVIQTLYHPVFSGLLALSLVLRHTVSDQEAMRDFTLPQLRYLDITLYTHPSFVGVPTVGTVSSWRFPMLTLLRVEGLGEHPKKEVPGLIRAHSRQLVELHASDLGAEFPTSEDWWSFCSLQLFVVNSLDMLADALSSVGTLWTRKSNSMSNETMIVETTPRRLTMSLQYPRITRYTNAHIIQEFEGSQSILPFLDFAVSQTWDSIQTTLTESEYRHDTYSALKESLELMESLGVDFVDPAGNGLDSYEARCLKSAVQRGPPELLKGGRE